MTDFIAAVLIAAVLGVIALAVNTLLGYLAVEVVGEFTDLNFNQAVAIGILLTVAQGSGASVSTR